MLEYKYAVVSTNDNHEWGLFKSHGVALMLIQSLQDKKWEGVTFQIKTIHIGERILSSL